MCIYIYIYVYTHTHIHTYVYIYIYIYVCKWLPLSGAVGGAASPAPLVLPILNTNTEY